MITNTDLVSIAESIRNTCPMLKVLVNEDTLQIFSGKDKGTMFKFWLKISKGARF